MGEGFATAGTLAEVAGMVPPGATAAAKFRQAYEIKKGSAAAGDANGSSERAEHIPDFIRVR